MSQAVLSVAFSDQNFLCVYHFSHALYNSRLFKMLLSDHPDHILARVRIVKVLSVYFLDHTLASLLSQIFSFCGVISLTTGGNSEIK